MNFIKIRGARENNLKNIDLDIPKNKLIVFTGVSGSGKSSLAFNTIYAEGQRRYVESLSSYARQFLDMQKKPDVDIIEGLSPAISIEQKTTSKNPRSTVGTITEIYDYYRLLWARIGIPHSPITGLPIKSQTISEMVEWTLKIPSNTNIYIMAPFIKERKGEYKKEILFLIKQGYQRAIIDGELYDLSETPSLDKNKKHTINIIIDRISIPDEKDEDFSSRIYSSFEASLRLVPESVLVKRLDTNEDILFSRNYACPVSGFAVPKIEPRLFSFNSPTGACQNCGGLGIQLSFDLNLIVPDESKSILDGAIAPWSRNGMLTQYEHLLKGLKAKYDIPLNKPWNTLSQEHQNILLYGTGEESIKINWNGFKYSKPFEGIINNLQRRWTESPEASTDLSRYQNQKICPVCHGKRLSVQALCIKIDKKDIMDITDLSVNDSLAWFKELPLKLTNKEKEISKVILKEIISRLEFLQNVGLGYLTLSRSSGTLSGGEAQRIRLASQIGSGLSGVLYVLDEPSIGLHQSDNDKLINTLKMLRDKDNTVIVVEHDEDAMRNADFLVDIGKGAGIGGGKIVASGTPEEVIENEDSLTGQYLRGIKKIEVPQERRKGNGNSIILKGATSHNLKNIDVEFPLGKLIVLTGVSGSGKSTLLINTLYPILMKYIYNSNLETGAYKSIEGTSNIDKVVDIDQSPIGRTPRSNPATYTGVFTDIRNFFASLPEAKAKGYTIARFSFNLKGGRCESCQGDGQIKIEMNFLPDVYVKCDKCDGKRYNEETLSVKYKGKSIADVLDMTVEEAYRFFINIPSIAKKLELLKKVGLDYIQLGQSSLELSGGEAQRIKLSKELSARGTGKTIYILDEPTTGLHFEDIKMLLSVLQELVDAGNTVIIIEHNLEVIKVADWIIDMGPFGGSGGGRVIATGTPEEIVENKDSLTGKYLKKYLK